MDWGYTHFRILFEAHDASFLGQLVAEKTMVGLTPASHWPELPITEARVALAELLDDGRVMLGGPVGMLASEEARRVVDDDEAWTLEARYELVMTDKGVDLWNRLQPRFWPEAS
ncbi:MAG: hypothetical protein ACJ744_15765 [Gaiellaceae bacterium]|jgi:hypothetical protein